MTSIPQGDTLHIVLTVTEDGVPKTDIGTGTFQARAVLGMTTVEGTFDLGDASNGVVRAIFDSTLVLVGDWKTQVRVTHGPDTVTLFDEIVTVTPSLWS